VNRGEKRRRRERKRRKRGGGGGGGGGGDRERTPPKCGQVDACLYLSIIESQWCSVTELAWQYIDSVFTNT